MCKGLDLFCWLSSFLDAIARLFMHLLELLVAGLILVIDLLPLPFTADDVTTALNSLPPEVYWAFDLFQVGTGVSMVMSAYLARFIIRRLPVVG